MVRRRQLAAAAALLCLLDLGLAAASSLAFRPLQEDAPAGDVGTGTFHRCRFKGPADSLEKYLTDAQLNDPVGASSSGRRPLRLPRIFPDLPIPPTPSHPPHPSPTIRRSSTTTGRSGRSTTSSTCSRRRSALAGCPSCWARRPASAAPTSTPTSPAASPPSTVPASAARTRTGASSRPTSLTGRASSGATRRRATPRRRTRTRTSSSTFSARTTSTRCTCTAARLRARRRPCQRQRIS